MAIAHCPCGVSLGRETQTTMLGEPELCPACTRQKRAAWMLKACPDDGTPEWDRLTSWERTFIESMRRHQGRGNRVSEAQYLSLEQIYEKTNR